MKKSLLVVAAIFMALATGASAGNYCRHKPKQPPVVVPTVVVTNAAPKEHPTGFCPNGKRAVAGTDGHVPASGNTNDKCDWSAPARVPHPQYPNG